MCIVLTCESAYDVINVEINLSFLTKVFSDMTKLSGQKLNYHKNEKSFKDEIKRFCIIFKRTFNEANKTKSKKGESST